MALLDGAIFDAAPLPLALLREEELQHNIALFARWCREHEVSYAPHAKTHMAREIVERQLRADAWGMTVATVGQAERIASWGVPRVIVASEVADRVGLDRLVRLAGDRWLALFADSEAGVALAADAVARGPAGARLRVLVELGHADGRTGARSVEAAERVAAAVVRSPGLELAGVGAFEGTIAGEAASVAGSVEDFLAQLRTLADRLHRAGALAEGAVVTAGGSLHPHRVAAILDGAWARALGLRTVVRSGCYVSHDVGVYDADSPFGSVRPVGAERLRPALEVWGAVLSRPEPGLAILGVGKRDVSFDAGLPTPVWRRRDGAPRTPLRRVRVVALNDQHAYLRLEDDGALRVGDLVGLGISHPCTTFDRWRRIALVDGLDRAVGEVVTSFE